MSVVRDLELVPITDERDPDDWRPNSRFALATDSEASLTVIVEELAPGDKIPLHRHKIDEVLLYESGDGHVVLHDERHEISAGSIAFVPAGTPHATVNGGSQPIRIRAVFPSHLIDIEYLERNPAPGTDDDRPRPPVIYDARTGEITTG